MDQANELHEAGVLDEREAFIDAAFVPARGGGAEVGLTKVEEGMKIMAIVDRHGLPLSVSTHAANHHEVRLVQLCFDFYLVEAKPHDLIGDRAYDSDELDATLREQGRGDDRAASEEPAQAAGAGPQAVATYSEALGGRAVLCMDREQASRSDPVGVPS